jgi:epoxyqueuosine reductase
VCSSPLAEKALAMRAGLGFIGKNRLLTNSELGSFILLGEIITNMQLKPDKPIGTQACGNCRKCIEACPTGALLDDNFNAGRCISYLTMRCKGEIDTELKKKIGLHLFGCDECMLACPYNGRSPFCAKQQFGFTAKPGNVRPDDVIGWTEKDFEDFAGNSAMLQIGLDRIKRNALICKRNQQ